MTDALRATGMPLPSVVETPRLILRRPRESDRYAWVALHRDPRTYWHAPHVMAQTDEDVLEFLAVIQQHWDQHGFGFWVAEDRESGDVVGVCGLRHYSGERGEFLNLYYRLTFDHLRRGLGREMSRASAAFAAEFLPGLHVWALVKEHNTPSVRTALASGFERNGTRVLRDDLPDEAPSTIFQSPLTEAVSEFDAETREQVLDLWMRTNDAGGAVGFLPGASREHVDAALSAHEASMARGGDPGGSGTTAVLLRSPVDSRVLGLAFIVPVSSPLMAHVASVYRVMTDPESRGRNLGRLLMAGLHGVARRSGLEILSLGVRSGTGTTAFYESCGYREIGRRVGAIRIGPGDDRDDIQMARRLDGRSPEPDPRN